MTVGTPRGIISLWALIGQRVIWYAEYHITGDLIPGRYQTLEEGYRHYRNTGKSYLEQICGTRRRELEESFPASTVFSGHLDHRYGHAAVMTERAQQVFVLMCLGAIAVILLTAKTHNVSPSISIEIGKAKKQVKSLSPQQYSRPLQILLQLVDKKNLDRKAS